jgi:4-aminobutyrate aminotransferase/(S)-3-amino-2-methylpropionate transaminase
VVERKENANAGCDRTYIAFDTTDAAGLVKSMKSLGVNIGTCGVNTVRLRPMLIFEESHSEFDLVLP